MPHYLYSSSARINKQILLPASKDLDYHPPLSGTTPPARLANTTPHHAACQHEFVDMPVCIEIKRAETFVRDQKVCQSDFTHLPHRPGRLLNLRVVAHGELRSSPDVLVLVTAPAAFTCIFLTHRR